MTRTFVLPNLISYSIRHVEYEHSNRVWNGVFNAFNRIPKKTKTNNRIRITFQTHDSRMSNWFLLRLSQFFVILPREKSTSDLRFWLLHWALISLGSNFWVFYYYYFFFLVENNQARHRLTSPSKGSKGNSFSFPFCSFFVFSSRRIYDNGQKTSPTFQRLSKTRKCPSTSNIH